MKSLTALYEHELRDLHDAESQLIEALPRMAEAAEDADLKRHLEAHAKLSKTHRERLGSILREMGTEGGTTACAAMKGILSRADQLIGDADTDGAVRDAALLGIAQKAEHYEMASYGTLRTYADVLGHADARRTLQKTLDEEGRTDDRLSTIANESVNAAATVTA